MWRSNSSLNLNMLHKIILLFWFIYPLSAKLKATEEIRGSQLCTDPVENAYDTRNTKFKLQTTTITPFYDASSEEVKSDCLYIYQNSLVKVVEIKLSMEPWSNSGFKNCKTFLRFSKKIQVPFCGLISHKNPEAGEDFIKFSGSSPLLPMAIYYNISLNGIFHAKFFNLHPGEPFTSYKYMQIYFIIVQHGSMTWKIQQYKLKHSTGCNFSLDPEYLRCADYSYSYFSSNRIDGSGLESNNNPVASQNSERILNNSVINFIKSRLTCPAFQAFSINYQNGSTRSRKMNENKVAYYDISSSLTNPKTQGCTFQYSEKGSEIKSRVVVETVYSDSTNTIWTELSTMFSASRNTCSNFMKFAIPSQSEEVSTKLCLMPATTLHSIEYSPSIWLKEDSEFWLTYAQVPQKQMRTNSKREIIIFLTITTENTCELRAQRYTIKNDCDSDASDQFNCLSFNCSEEDAIWSVMTIAQIYNQYSDKEYYSNMWAWMQTQRNNDLRKEFTMIVPTTTYPSKTSSGNHKIFYLWFPILLPLLSLFIILIIRWAKARTTYV